MPVRTLRLPLPTWVGTHRGYSPVMMRNTSRFATKITHLAAMTRLVMGLSLGLVPSCALDEDQGQAVTATDEAALGDSGLLTMSTLYGADDLVEPVCQGSGRFHCLAQVHKSNNTLAVKQFAAPAGFGPPDLQAAYNIPATITASPTVAIVDAYGYTALESDLGKYRAQYGLPACTIANGCLKVVNSTGLTSPLPPNPPAADDWTVETALDVDMVSAACPTCKILVIQANDPGDTLLTAQATAKQLGATVISNSWGGAEQPGTPATAEEAYFNQAGVTVFVASGDNGYNDAGQGPDYPGTSQYAIAVGGTALVKDGSARGWSEHAWTSGGSACSLSIPKPAYQDLSPCQYKATTDIAAVGDPATGLAVYNAANGGWISVGGTSASSPFVAAIFAATGNGAVMTGKFVKDNAAKLFDVLTGTNGTCPAGTGLLCTATAGWDGPTGYGTPNVALLIGATGGGTDPTGSGSGSGSGTGTGNGDGTGGGPNDVIGGCSTGGGASGVGFGAMLGLAAVRRRRRA